MEREYVDRKEALTATMIEDRFGESVAGSAAHGRRNGATILVGAPSAPGRRRPGVRKPPLVMNEFGNVTSRIRRKGPKWTLEAILEHPDAYRAKHNFGGRGAIAIDGDCAVVGASGVEAAYVYRRVYHHTHKKFKWEFTEKLQSSDYDYDVLFDGLITKVHEQGFGSSVAFSGVIAIGALRGLRQQGCCGDAETRHRWYRQ